MRITLTTEYRQDLFIMTSFVDHKFILSTSNRQDNLWHVNVLDNGRYITLFSTSQTFLRARWSLTKNDLQQKAQKSLQSTPVGIYVFKVNNENT